MVEEKNKGGRPRKEITEKDWATMISLCKIQCTADEISMILKISIDTIERRIKDKYAYGFADFIKIHSADGKASLRRTQFALAKKSAGMAIWLGKQYLGQREPDMSDGFRIEDAQAVYSEALRE